MCVCVCVCVCINCIIIVIICDSYYHSWLIIIVNDLYKFVFMQQCEIDVRKMELTALSTWIVHMLTDNNLTQHRFRQLCSPLCYFMALG